jgi:hypothetical protein
MKTDAGPAGDHKHPSDFALEHLLAGEGGGPLAETWRRHVSTCGACAAKLAGLAANSARYRASPQARSLRRALVEAEDSSQRSRRPLSRRLRRLPIPAALVAAASIAICIERPPAPRDDMQVKGPGRMGVVVWRGGGPWPWDGKPLQPGDDVQLSWSSAESGFLTVLARETGGDVMVLVPERGDSAQATSAGPPRPVGSSIKIMPDSQTLDVAACFSVRAWRVDALVEEWRRHGRDWCSGQTQTLRLDVQR